MTSPRTDRSQPIELLGQLPSVRQPIAGEVHTAEQINSLVVEGTLYRQRENGAVTCYACAHECTIKPNGRGICQVRYNLGGKLYVPQGYVAALQCDPTEKKPFFHLYPGSDTLTFGMLGCDLHCAYCFTGDVRVVTNQGVRRFDSLFEESEHIQVQPDGGYIGYYPNLTAITQSGAWRPVKAIFKHHYQGKLAVIKPYYLPEFRCTSDHKVYATHDPQFDAKPIPANELTIKHYLAIPRHFSFSKPQIIDTRKELQNHQTTYKITWDLTLEELNYILTESQNGLSSKEIGIALGKSGSHIRHIRSKYAKRGYQVEKSQGFIVENEQLRFPHERLPGIPLQIPVDENLAYLLGIYCAEGSALEGAKRPNSYTINFSFSHKENELAQKTKRLIEEYFQIKVSIVKRTTTLNVTCSKASLGILLKTLVGSSASTKQIPLMLFDAPRNIVEAFIKGYIEGDGHYYENGKVTSTTISENLAYGLGWLALKLGYLPSIYTKTMPPTGEIQGRTVNFAPLQYTVVWYQNSKIKRKVIETANHYLIPLREIDFIDYSGDVYNMEVEEEHNYLANFCLVKNCQNWDISQALRNPEAGRPPTHISAKELIQLGVRNGAKNVASSYNEPLITSEWAVEVFKEATQAGLTCAFVSNGNATREVLEFIRPYTSAYKIDLKSMNAKNYRQLGTVLERVLDGIRMVHEMGFWLEIVTLVVPNFNDSEAELREAAQFIHSISPDIPWHVTGFHKDYKMQAPPDTQARQLVQAAEIGREAGLHYVYAGNRPGQVGDFEHTCCPTCHRALIKRLGYLILEYHLTAQGTCPHCQTPIAGYFTDQPQTVRLGTPEDLYSRRPRLVR